MMRRNCLGMMGRLANLGIFDIVVYTCSIGEEENKLNGHPGLLFNVDNAPDIICKGELWNAFD